MKIIEDYLKKDLKRRELQDWSEIRRAYMERAMLMIENDWQAPAYLTSMENQAGRREGRIMGNINDYTRDNHDLARIYEQKFVREYVPRTTIIPDEAFVTSSGMAALTTIILMLHREYGTEQTVLVGKHSYFQNQEILSRSFKSVISFDESSSIEWKQLIEQHQPRAVFVDSLCNEPSLTRPNIEEIAHFLAKIKVEKTYLVIDNSLLSISFNWRAVLKYRSKKLEIIGWESLNKYYQFGLDRVTGGVVWGSSRIGVKIDQARRHGGTIMSDFAVAMLPSPSRKILSKYIDRVWDNRTILQKMLGERVRGEAGQVVVNFTRKMNYHQIQTIIKRIVNQARREGVQVSAGTSFGLPTTRVYLTARQSEYTHMFLRISVGVEESSIIEQIGQIISNSCRM